MSLALDLTGIRKTFDGFVALDGASLTVERGKIHALLGENGAGKSTLVNIAAGLYAPDEGRVVVDGREVQIAGPAHARDLKIGMVHQHFKLVKPFNAIDNVLLGNPAGSYRSGSLSMASLLERHAKELGFDLDPRRPVGQLSVAEQQRVEILKVLVGGAEIIILDEPTAVLTDAEAQRLLKTMRGLAERGKAVVLVTHKLPEVKAFAHVVTVMRGGRTLATVDPADRSIEQLTNLIVGADVRERMQLSARTGDVVLDVRELVAARGDGHQTVSRTSFAVRSGEIYGIAGVGGNGQTELAEAIMGVRLATGGRIEMAGNGDVTAASPELRRSLGLASIAADRHTYGLAGQESVANNFAISGLIEGQYGSWLSVDRGRVRSEAKKAIGEFDVQGVRDANQKAALLSGGNAQKLVLARELSGSPKVIIAHSPSRGLDVRASASVHERLRGARDHGAAVLLISEDLDEVLILSDRIGVMNRGHIVAEFKCPVGREIVGRAMVGHA